MKTFLGCRCLLVLLLAALWVRASAAESAATLIGEVQKRVEELKTLQLDPKTREELVLLWRAMGSDLTQLQDLLAHVALTEKFAEALKANAEALRVVIDARTPPERKVAICRGVERDLDAKAAAMRDFDAVTPAAKKGGGLVRLRDLAVTAYTLTGSREIEGCEVWFVPEAWKDEESRHRRFQRVSSPTADELAPGYYVFWARRDNKEGARVPITISAAGVRIDLPAP